MARITSSEQQEKLVAEELSFLQHQMADEERRREVIEGKIGQLLGQVSIVISIVALFIPMIADQMNDLPIWGKILFICLFLIVVVAFICSIWIASTTWIINRYGYLRPELEDMSENGRRANTALIFTNRYKKVLIETIAQHIDINNKKGTSLIRAGLAFRLGILLLGLLVVCLSIVLAFTRQTPKEVNIKNTVAVRYTDTAKCNEYRPNVDSAIKLKHEPAHVESE